MKVKQLIKQLQALDPDMDVLMAQDAEGNGFNKLSDLEPASYDDSDRYEVEIGPYETDPDDPEFPAYDKKCIVIWP